MRSIAAHFIRGEISVNDEWWGDWSCGRPVLSCGCVGWGLLAGARDAGSRVRSRLE